MEHSSRNLPLAADMAVAHGPFTVGFGAPLAAHELPPGCTLPDIVIVDLNGAGCVPKIENHLFQHLFRTALQDGIGAELALENRRIMTFDKGGVAAPEADLTRRNEILARARRKGFEPLLTPGVPAFLSRRMTVLVPDAAQVRRVEDIVLNAFIHRDKSWFAARLREFRRLCPEHCRLSDAAIDRVTTAFDQARSFTSPPGLFHNPKTGSPFPDDVIRGEKLRSIIDIRALTAEPQRIQRGQGGEGGELEVRLDADKVVISTPGKQTVTPAEALRAGGGATRRWRRKCVGILTRLLAKTDDLLRIVNFGTGDALYVGSGEDFTNFAFVRGGRMLLVDPSEMTVRNLAELGLLESVEVIYQSHVHFDHLGGVLELARRLSRGEGLPRFRLLAACPVYLQILEVLSAYTGRDRSAFDALLELVPSARMTTSDLKPDGDGEVEEVPLRAGAFAGITCHLMRTRHFVPTYALRMATPHGTVAYLVDSSMPPVAIRGERNPQFDDFLNFFDTRSGVDVLIADCGEVQERDDNIHIAPSALLRVFPAHARRGTLWTVHSPIAQKARDLQRFEPFDVIEVCPHQARMRQAESFARRLLSLGAFRNRAFRITDAQARRLGRVACLREFRRGDRILEKHEDVRNPENNKVHVILSGEVSVAEEGREMRAGERLGPGDLFGERAIFGAEVAALAYWQIPERRRAKVMTRHEFDSGAYFTWNPGLAEHDIAAEFEQEPELRDRLTDLFHQTQKLQRTRTAVVLSDEAGVLEVKAAEFYKIFEHFVHAEADLEAEAREEKIRETLGALVLSAASASKRMRLDDFIALVELDHVTEVMEPIFAMAAAKRAGDKARIKSLKWPPNVCSHYSRVDPVSRVIDANLSAFLGFASVFHDQYVAGIDVAAYLDPTLATPERLARLVEEGVLDGDSERVRAYLARYSNAKKHVKLQRQDVRDLARFAEAVAARTAEGSLSAEDAARENAAKLLQLYEKFPPKQDVLSSLYAEWKDLMAEIDRDYQPDAREPYKDYLARLQTKAIANILTILLYVRLRMADGHPPPGLDELLLWIHAAWSLDNDWAEQAGMTWEELERFKPGDIKKDWVALRAVIEQLQFKDEFRGIIAQGDARFPSHPQPGANAGS